MEEKLSRPKNTTSFGPALTELSANNGASSDLKSLDLTNQATFTPSTFERWEGAKVEKISGNHLEAVSSDQNYFYSPLENVSASPIDTIRSIISPR